MTPIETALAKYGQPEPGKASLYDMIGFCARFHGAVISTPTVFLLALPCHHTDPPETFDTLSPLQSPETADTWHILLAAGTMEALRVLAATSRLPFVSYFRRDIYRVRPITRFLS